MPDDRPFLEGVTLVAATSVALEPTIWALEQSLRQMRFGAVLLLSDRAPDLPPGSEIRWRQISSLQSKSSYSRFMLSDLHHYIETDHALCVQWDGYVLDAAGWRTEFLDYDYIGAPWPHFSDGYNVGNGGFSLRSRRLLSACARQQLPEDMAEDIVICRLWRAELEDRFDIRFAPQEIALRFSYERTMPDGDEFGFHGVFNMIGRLDAREMKALLKKLEPILLTNVERRELLVKALRYREFALAWQILRRGRFKIW